jgi:CRP/FNR family transcriptional regulator
MTTWTDHFPGLAALEPEVRATLVDSAKVVRVPQGTTIFGPGRPAENLLLVMDGQVKVRQISENGREIVLYRVHGGESCVMTTASLMAFEDYAAEGIAETDVEAVAIPRQAFDDAIAKSPTFRRFVFQAYSRRITDLFLTIEEVAFGKMDVRLAQKLVDLAGGGTRVATTHGALAGELGTAREVISRQMAEFQRRGWVAQSRGTVELLKPDELRSFAKAA